MLYLGFFYLEPYDSRSLFDRLEEHRRAKQEEVDEAKKFKNQFRGIDDEEAAFLDTVDTLRTDMVVFIGCERAKRAKQPHSLANERRCILL